MPREPIRKEIDEERAAALLGLTRLQLREWWKFSGLAHQADIEAPEQRWFTYEELYRLCRWMVRAAV